MSAIEPLAKTILEGHQWLEATVGDVTPEQAHWQPPGLANPIAAVYAHVVLGTDFTLNSILNHRKPLFIEHGGGTAGLSELMPVAGWDAWARRVVMDLPVFRSYAAAVYGAWDTYLDSLADEHLDRTVNLDVYGMGTRLLSGVLTMQIQHFSCHIGEIACLKGLQGSVGYRAGTAGGIG